jgi:hypothetical protein
MSPGKQFTTEASIGSRSLAERQPPSARQSRVVDVLPLRLRCFRACGEHLQETGARRAARSGPARRARQAPARGSGDDDLAGTARAHATPVTHGSNLRAGLARLVRVHATVTASPPVFTTSRLCGRRSRRTSGTVSVQRRNYAVKASNTNSVVITIAGLSVR